MTKLNKLKQQIIDNNTEITNLQSDNDKLQKKVDEIGLTQWDPDNGDFIVHHNGDIFNKHQWVPIKILDGSTTHGCVRKTHAQARLARNNMRKFNRLSCFMNDSNPHLEITELSAALVFYDYESKLLTRLQSIIKKRGEL